MFQTTNQINNYPQCGHYNQKPSQIIRFGIFGLSVLNPFIFSEKPYQDLLVGGFNRFEKILVNEDDFFSQYMDK